MHAFHSTSILLNVDIDVHKHIYIANCKARHIKLNLIVSNRNISPNLSTILSITFSSSNLPPSKFPI